MEFHTQQNDTHTINSSEKFTFIEKSFLSSRMEIKDLLRMGKHGWRLYSIDKDAWRNKKGVAGVEEHLNSTKLTYHFMREVDWGCSLKKTCYEYEELVIWHHEYEEEARWYAMKGWSKAVVLPHILPKEIPIMRNGVKESLPTPCYIYIYIRPIEMKVG